VEQLNGESHFHNDLGLDSLDTVEVVMAIEEVSRIGCGVCGEMDVLTVL
jgi:acyl carrier protein